MLRESGVERMLVQSGNFMPNNAKVPTDSPKSAIKPERLVEFPISPSFTSIYLALSRLVRLIVLSKTYVLGSENAAPRLGSAVLTAAKLMHSNPTSLPLGIYTFQNHVILQFKKTKFHCPSISPKHKLNKTPNFKQ
jgi:hypothetical protein